MAGASSSSVALALAVYPEGGAGGVAMTSAYTAAHEGTISDHGRLFFSGDSAWAEQDFCGRTGGSDWTAPVREKLLRRSFLTCERERQPLRRAAT